jgi:S1-C subfamily serine protease
LTVVKGKPQVPTPGIGVVAADEAVGTRLGTEGVVVVRTISGSAAEKAGLRGMDPKTGALGDVIVAVNGKPVRSLADLTDQLEQIGVGGTAELSVKRGSTTTSVRVEVADLGRPKS